MSGKRSWADPDWEPEERVDFEDAPFGSRVVLMVILLGGLAVGVLVALWHLF